nr:G-type lectin S-receptor-like serine/threonine-protein kinase At1g11330 [Coffea arabica]
MAALTRKRNNESPVSMRESFVLVLACCLTVCTAIDTITIARPVQDHETLVSSGQTFKLGFFSPANASNRYVGIMYDNIPGTTVIWVANRDKPVKDSTGILTIAGDGNLVILNGEREIIWSSNASKSVASSSAKLLDTGNLVLTDNSDGSTMWESFQIPTDSLVPKMRLSAGAKEKLQLTSWRSPSDPSIGDFSAGLNLFRPQQFFVWEINVPHWRSGPRSGNTFIGIAGMSSAYQSRFDLVEDNSGST